MTDVNKGEERVKTMLTLAREYSEIKLHILLKVCILKATILLFAILKAYHTEGGVNPC